MSAVELALSAAAFVIGVTGAWSPCGFSMVETIGLAGEPGRRPTTLAACATFAVGAVFGGAITFGALAWLGDLAHGVGGRAAYLIAAAIAVLAALLEARDTRIAPQIRRQLPEHWRWTMPLPLAATLYGVLLGLGFTTFVLTFGVWALAGIAFALGHLGAGLAIGIAFGLGRSLPVAVLAPAIDRPFGVRCTQLMIDRPALYAGFRLGDAAGLLLVAAALAIGAGGTASAAHTVVYHAADPSAAGRTIVFQRPGGSGVMQRGGHVTQLPGTDPAVGGPYVAVRRRGGGVDLLARGSLQPLDSAPIAADALAVSKRWLAYRVGTRRRDGIGVVRIRSGGRLGAPRRIVTVSRPSQLGRPSLDGGTLVFAVAHRHVSKIRVRRMGTKGIHTVASSRTEELANPSIEGHTLLFVRARRLRQNSLATSPLPFVQELVLQRLGGGGAHTIYSRGSDGKVWSTALARVGGHLRAYFTLLRGAHDTQIVQVTR